MKLKLRLKNYLKSKKEREEKCKKQLRDQDNIKFREKLIKKIKNKNKTKNS